VRAQMRVVSDADPEDMLLLDDLLGIADPNVELPKIDPDARRRRLIDAASLARKAPAVYVVEDTHWIDEVSDSMLADLVTVVPQTHSLVLITYRPEYAGALSRVPGAQSIALTPLTDPETATLVSQLLGWDPSVGELGQMIVERAGGNPFFAEEIVRELAERGVLRGNRSAYISTVGAAEVSVPATVQATIAARIDRLDPAAKRTLSTAAIIGSRFNRDLLETVGIDPVLDDLVGGEFIDQVTFTGDPAYVFHHPLIRTVAYESQLKSDRAELHLRLADAIESRSPASGDENAALIAEHLEAAGDGHVAYSWHMRAATWATNRDIAAARQSWERATRIADALPADDPNRATMRIAPRTMLCAHVWRVGGSGVADTGFDELRELCGAANDQMSLVMAMSGVLVSMTLNCRLHELCSLAKEYVGLLESTGDTTLTVGLLNTATQGMFAAGHVTETLSLVQRVIELADNDATKGNFFFESPLAWAITLRGLARCSVGHSGWRDDLQAGLAMAREAQGITQATVTTYGCGMAVLNGALVPDAAALEYTADALRTAQRSGDDLSLAWTRVGHGIMLGREHGGDHPAVAIDLLAKGRQQALRHADLLTVAMADIQLAECKAQSGDTGAAIEIARATVAQLFDRGEVILRGPASTVLAESLLRRGTAQDLQEAQAAIDRLAAVPTDPALVLNEIQLLRMRTLLARAHGDDTDYREYRDRYRALATSLCFEGHMKWAEAMP
jgi:adenylate cyclase